MLHTKDKVFHQDTAVEDSPWGRTSHMGPVAVSVLLVAEEAMDAEGHEEAVEMGARNFEGTTMRDLQ